MGDQVAQIVDVAARQARRPVDQGGLPGGIADIVRGISPTVVSHYNIAPVINIFATIDRRDLGAVAADINAVLDEMKAEAPKATTAVLRGQSATMNTAFSGLAFGLAGAVVLIYLLIVVNFQRWLDPFVIITALPGALPGSRVP